MDVVQADKERRPAPVLVVDDDRATRELMALTLETAGHEVVQAASGHQALDLLSLGSFSAVVLDNHMPGFSGLDMLRVLRNRPETQTLPALLVNGADGVSDRIEGRRTGASDYIVKPFDPDELVARVEAQLRTQAMWIDVVEAHRRERQAIAAALATSDSDASVEDAAWLICSELERLGYPGVAVLAATGVDTVVPIGVAGLGEWQLPLGRRLPTRLASYLLGRAEHGPWIEYMDEDHAASGYAGGPVPDGE